MRRLIIFIFSVFAISSSIGAQGLTWSIDFNTIFDNREGDDYLSPDETLFLTRLSPEVGVSFLNGVHNISGGVSWIQPVGNGWKDYKICPTLYYHYDTPQWKMSFGMFPRTQLIEPLPTFLLSDSMAYHQPNIRGVLVQYMRPRGYAELSLDWRSLQSETQREAFNVNFNGRWNPKGVFILGGHLQLNHLAKQKNAPDGQGVNDDIMVNPYIGLDLSHKTALDSFVVKAGSVVALERSRASGQGWDIRAGALIDILAQWKWLGLKETFYAGANLYPLYNEFGNLLNMGDPYFQAPVYSCTDLNAFIIRNQFVNLEASLIFQVSKPAFGFWQQLKLRVYLDNKLWSKRNDKTKTGEYLRNIY